VRVLVAGGSGFVGTMVLPFLQQDHQLRVFDLAPPQDSSVQFCKGSVNDGHAVRSALSHIEAVVYMVMGRAADGSYAVHDIDLSYDLNVKGLHRVLHAAQGAGLTRAVYVSTLSVHGPRPAGKFPNEDIPCDAPGLYGFTKYLGELTCEYFVRVHKMTVIALRLNGPLTREDWQRQCQPGKPNPLTAAPDIARAISLALTAPVSGFHTLAISGDYEGKVVNCARAKQVLGWEPLERPRPE
jgi:nucleoside-diphosphate-sugar epimerase